MSIYFSRYALNTYYGTPYFQAHVPAEYPTSLVLQGARAFRNLPPNLRQLAALSKRWAVANGQAIPGIDRWYDAEGHELDPETGRRLTDAEVAAHWNQVTVSWQAGDVPLPPGGFPDPLTWQPPVTRSAEREPPPTLDQLLEDVASRGLAATEDEYGINFGYVPPDEDGPDGDRFADRVHAVIASPYFRARGAELGVLQHALQAADVRDDLWGDAAATFDRVEEYEFVRRGGLAVTVREDVINSALGRLFGKTAKPAEGGGANCGVGASGFLPGNTCGKGGGPGPAPTEKGAGAGHYDTAIHSPQFKAWFGDWEHDPKSASKVVDVDGKPAETANVEGHHAHDLAAPRTVFHGSPHGEITEFRKDKIARADDLHYGRGFYFTEDVEAAKGFSKGGQSAQATGNNPTVMSFFLKVHKPFDVDRDHIDPSKLPELDRQAVRAGLVQQALGDGGRSEAVEAGRRFDRGETKMTYHELVGKAGIGGAGASKEGVTKHLQELGHDGLTTLAPDAGEKGKNRFWIVFEPTQIKSTRAKEFKADDPITTHANPEGRNQYTGKSGTGHVGAVADKLVDHMLEGAPRDQESLRDISQGRCADFALSLYHALGKPADAEFMHTEDMGHGWLKVGGLHHDAEVPHGVKDWHDLPVTRGDEGEPHEGKVVSTKSAAKFAKAWTYVEGAGPKVHIINSEADVTNEDVELEGLNWPVSDPEEAELLGLNAGEELVGLLPEVEEALINRNPFHDAKGRFAKADAHGAKLSHKTVTATAQKAIGAEPKTTVPKGESKHAPNVEAKGKGGVTKSSRVGVAGSALPPPPGIGRLPNLTPHERAIEDSFAKSFEADPHGTAQKFRAIAIAATKPGEPVTFGTDDAKVLHPAWEHSTLPLDQRAQNRATLNLALHQTANAIAKHAFVQHLSTLKPGDEVMVTVGGCGAGKGYALKNVPDALAAKMKSKAVWDSAGDQNATENHWIQEECEKRGLKAHYVFVHADPHNNWAHPQRGVVARAGDPADGRMVDAKVFADSYAIGAKNHQAFYEGHKDNPNAQFTFLDNSKGAPAKLDGIPPEALKIDRRALAYKAIHEVLKSGAPDHVKRGALIGVRVWPND